MKRIGVISLVLVISMGAAVFAQGAAETAEDGTVSLSLRTFSGPVSVDGIDVIITSGSQEYVVHYHPMRVTGLNIDPGDYIRLEGYLLPAEVFNDGRNHMLAARAVIGAESYLVGPVAEQGRLLLPLDELYRLIPGMNRGAAKYSLQDRHHHELVPMMQHRQGRFSTPVPRPRGWR